MPYSHIINLFHLICSSGTPVDAYQDAFLEALDGWDDEIRWNEDEKRLFGFCDNHNLIQKAGVLRFLAWKECLSEERILRESEIRAKYPWFWIDAIVYYDLDITMKEVIKCVKCAGAKEDKEVQELLMRLPLWIRLWGANRLALIKELNLKKENKEKIEQSFESRRVINKKEKER